MAAPMVDVEIKRLIDEYNRDFRVIRPTSRQVGSFTFTNSSTLVSMRLGTTGILLKEMPVDSDTGKAINKKVGKNRFHAVTLDNVAELEQLRDILCEMTGTRATPAEKE